MQAKLYSLPEIYDIAFFWDISQEIEFLGTLFKRYVPFEVKHILEPACGTGRFLRSLPKYGYHVTGYDSSPQMVAYAQKKIAEAGLQSVATVQREDMKSARFEATFDAALNSINSLGYLLSDKDMLSHLVNTGESLKSNGIYILHLSCAYDTESYGGDEWSMERDGIRVKTAWRIEREDKRKKISYQICRMEINDHDNEIRLEERHTLRLWFFEDFTSLVHKSGRFKLAAIYDERYRFVSIDTHISGELENLYYVLKAL